MVVVMIEDSEGIANLEEIVSVTGIDMVLEGAIDLSQSYGVPGQAQHPDVQAAITRIATVCDHHKVHFCAIPRVADQLSRWQARGVQAYLLGDDRSVSFRALKGQIGAMRNISAIA